MAKHRAIAIPGHQNCPFMRLRVWSLPWCPAFRWHMSIATCLLFTGTTNTGIVPTFPGGVVLMNKRWSLFSKSFSLRLYTQQSASEAFPRKKSFSLTWLFLGKWSQSRTWGITGSISCAWCQSSVQRLGNFLSWQANWTVLRMTSWSALSSSSIIQMSSVSARAGAPTFLWLSSSVTVSGSSLASIRSERRPPCCQNL